jgi:uncharacterized protein (DUF983 family)
VRPAVASNLRRKPIIIDKKISRMTQRVKVKVRPGELLRLPADCVNCNQIASERMRIRYKNGQLARFLELPLCDNCHRELNRKSGEEERLQRLGLVVASLIGMLTLVILFFLVFTNLPVWLRLFVALFPSIMVSAGIMLIFRRIGLRAVLPQKRNIRDSARMVDFSWRTTTFEFTNDDYARRFGQLNEHRLMD